MAESRTLCLDPKTVELMRVAGESFRFADIDGIREAIPDALSVQEVDHIGIQVANAVELKHPSRDGYSRGRRIENESIFNLGTIAISDGDLVTAESARLHLRRTVWSPSARIMSFMLGRMVKADIKRVVNSILDV